MFSTFPTLELYTKHSKLILKKLWKNHDEVISINLNAFSKAAMIELASARSVPRLSP